MKNWENSKFKYLWKATFENKVIVQHPQDLYSKHDPKADHNPSSFRDFQDYFDKHSDELVKFELISRDSTFTVSLSDPERPQILLDRVGRYGSLTHNLLHKEKRPLKDIRIIYFRNMEATIIDGQLCSPIVKGYQIGYQGIDQNGNNRKKVISVL